jgi:hypothetical protein
METNPIPALMSALAAAGLGKIVMYAPVVVAVAAVLAATLPQPAANSPWRSARRLLDLLAMNVGAAKNASSGAGGASPPISVIAMFCLGALGLSACSAPQIAAANATAVADVQAVNAVVVQDARLFCAVATPTGPLVVAVANAAGAPIIATGAAQAAVNTACAAANGIPVSPPAVGTSVPTVTTTIAPQTAQNS